MRKWLGLATVLALAGCAGNRPRSVGDQLSPQALYELRLPRSGGGQIDLGQYRGRVLALDFFATWSQASLLAISGYRVLQGRYEAQGLSLVGVSLDELGDDLVAPFAAGMQIPYPVVLASPEIKRGQSLFGPIDAIPTLLIFDRQGRLAKVFVGLVPPELVERVLRELL